MKLTLVRQTTCWVPTWKGWLLLAALLFASSCLLVLNLHPFLSPNRPLPAATLVIESWMADYGLEQTAAYLRTNQCQLVVLTGGPLDAGSYLSEFKTFPEVTAQSLKKLGVPEKLLRVVPSPPAQRDRTYEAALALKSWLNTNAPAVHTLNLASIGPHARRSQYLFQKALGKDFSVGILAWEDTEYDARKWWQYSKGFRMVLDETIAYLYARFWFHPQPAD